MHNSSKEEEKSERKTFHTRNQEKTIIEEIVLNQDLILCISLLLFVIDEWSSSLIWERYDEDGFNNLNKTILYI